VKKTDPRVYRLVLGKVVAALRKKRGISQQEFAGNIGVSQPTLSRIERGQTMPDALVHRRIAYALGISSGQLNTYVDDALERTTNAAAGATKGKQGASPLALALGIAGFVGLAGLVVFAVAAIIDEIED